MSRLQRNLVIIVWACTAVVLLAAQFLRATGETPGGDSAAVQQGTAQKVAQPSVRAVQFSGVLHDALGAPLTGAQGVTFSLYAEQTGEAPLWLETQSVTADDQGRYSVLLGSMREDGLPQDLFTSNEARWLGVQANQPGAVEQPRVLLVSVPYALKAADAETLGGKPVTAFLLAPSADIAQSRDREGAEAAAMNDGLPTASVAVANRLVKYTDGAGAMDSSNVTDDGANVGIGAPSTGAKLHVAGSVPGTATSDLLSLSTTDGAIRSEITARGLQFWRFNNGVDNAGQIAFATPGGSPGIVMWTGPTFDQNRFDIVNYGSQFSLGYNADSGGQVLNIKPGGNVGIGTTAPTAKLDVNGDMKVSGNFIGTVSSSGILALPNTTNSTTGVFTLGGNRFLHNYGANNTFLGLNAGNFTMTGDANTAVGRDALTANTTGGSNTVVGAFALRDGTTSAANTAIGTSAMHSTTAGNYNVAVGWEALATNSTGDFNTAVGIGAMQFATTSEGTAVGTNAMQFATTGARNTAIGYNALLINTTGNFNTALGWRAGYPLETENANTTDSYNTFVGYNTGLVAPPALSLQNATAIGANAVVSASNALVLGSINGVNGATSGVNVGIGTASPTAKLDIVGDLKVSGNIVGTITSTSTGTLALPNSTNPTTGVLSLGGNPFLHNFGMSNTFVGQNSGNFAMTGSRNTATGTSALTFNTTGSNNTASGYNALAFNTTGNYNTASGYRALLSNTTGNGNSAIGSDALFTNTTGAKNTANGAFALALNTTGDENTASGYSALGANTTGFQNTGIGSEALHSNTTGNYNTATGWEALQDNSTGCCNTAIGSSVLNSNTVGNNNTAIGYSALHGNTTGCCNTAMGYFALFFNEANGNTAIGNGTLISNSYGTLNTAVGDHAGYPNPQNANTTGSSNTFIGSETGPGTSTQLNNATAIGANAVVSASNALVLGSINGVNGATSSVNVGIGTATPNRELEVNGGMRLNTATAKPACAASIRGTFWVSQGGAGVKDTVEVCAKDAADAYAWRAIY